MERRLVKFSIKVCCVIRAPQRSGCLKVVPVFSQQTKAFRDERFFQMNRYQLMPIAVRSTSSALLGSIQRCSTSTSQDTPKTEEKPDNSSQEKSESEVSIDVNYGLPQLTVPLPSRKELCRFTLRPVTHTLRDLVDQLQHEDRGIDRVVATTKDGVRIASSASIESLLMEDFDLIINDVSYRVIVPQNQRLTLEEMKDLSDVRQLVNKLYSALNVDEHQLLKERNIISQIEEIRTELGPLEEKRLSLVSGAERRTAILSWAGLGYMTVQFGFLARLTWCEYSWDIMEPVTYFITYGTAIVAYAYYVVTRQDFILPEVRDRQFLLSFYRRAQKINLNVGKYNNLKTRLSQLEGDLERLRDPLALNVPHTELKNDPAVYDTLAKAQISLRNLLRLKSNK